MVDRTGAARLEWRHWDRFTKVHINYTKATFCFLYNASIKLNSTIFSIATRWCGRLYR